MRACALAHPMAPSTLPKLPLCWLRALKARLMLASVLLERVERRSEQAILDLESSHIEQTAALLGQRVVLLQRMMRAAAERMPHAAATDADEAIRLLGARTAPMTTLDQLFVAEARGLVVVVLTMPVLGPRHRVVAVPGGTMRLNWHNLLDDLTVHSRDDRQQATTLLSDARGTIFAHPQAARLLAEAASEPLMAAAVARRVTQRRPVEPSAIVWRAGGHFTAIVGVPGPEWVLSRVVPDRQLLGGIDEDWLRAAGKIGELGAVLQRTLRERATGERHQRALMAQLDSVMAAAPIGIAITRHRQFELVSAE